jgi:hypothetical protein
MAFVVLGVTVLALVVTFAGCGGSTASSTTTSVTAGGSSTTATTAGGPTTTAAPPTTAGAGDASTTPTTEASATTISVPSTLSEADKAFVQALLTSVQNHTQELLDLGAFILAYESATDADIAKAEENVKKIGTWVDEVKAMTPSDGLKDIHAVLSQALTDYLHGFTDFVAAVKAKDDAKIKAALTAITEASKKYQSFGRAFGGLTK